ncbi:methyl-accepting chemotaxis protein [Salisediminibacterium selenitireducens]|nr:methyl-accepting chemotaxis protein [Salisediminibacterium selenitireducens]
MSVLLKPVEGLMNRLTYPEKFVLIFLLFFVPIIGSMGFILYSTQSEIDTVNHELTGLESTVKIQALIQNVQQHRGLSANYLGGNEGALTAMTDKQDEIAGRIADVNEVMEENRILEGHQAEWQGLTDTYEALKGDVTGMDAPSSFAVHTALIADLLTLSNRMADTTHLSLDSNVVRSHLASLITDDLIYVTEYMGQSRAIGSNVLASGTLSTDQQMDLIYLTEVMNERLSQAAYSMEVVFEENPDAEAAISGLYEDAHGASSGFRTLIDTEILNAGTYTYDADSYFDEATTAIDTVFTLIDANADLLRDELLAYSGRLTVERNLIIGVNVAAMVLAVLIFAGFYRSVKDNIGRIQAATGRIAKGDLTERITLVTKDETKDIEIAINGMVDAIQSLIQKNRQLADELSASAEELSASAHESARASELIADATQTVAEGADKQMTTVKRTSHAVNGMSGHLSDVTQNSERMLMMIEETATSTDDGVKHVRDVLSSMNQIDDAVEQSAGKMKQLEGSAREIGDIVGLITDISEQTNLLALNAAIEAARAGEHGRGFAVVADEVRKLADESNQSAVKIRDLIGTIQTETAEAATSMSTGSERVKVGLERADDVNRVFHGINGHMQNVTGMVHTVAGAIEQIASQSREIGRDMNEVQATAESSANASQDSSAASQEQLASTEEISSAAEALSKMAEDLQDVIQAFTIE